MPNDDHPIYIGQLIFMDMVKESENRPILARVALAFARKSSGYEVDFSDVINLPNWQEYHAILSMLALRPNAAICWEDDDLESLRTWALG